jgi:hypothetical protein
MTDSPRSASLAVAASCPRPARKSAQARGFAAAFAPAGGRGRGAPLRAHRPALPPAFGAAGDPAWLRAHFASVWCEFVRAEFSGPEDCAEEFGVRGQTARNWFEADHRPMGNVVWQASRRWGDRIAAAEARVRARLEACPARRGAVRAGSGRRA